jgi:hypothetical protein
MAFFFADTIDVCIPLFKPLNSRPLSISEGQKDKLPIALSKVCGGGSLEL